MPSNYERSKQLIERSNARQATGNVVVHTKGIPMESAPGRRTAYLSEPDILGSFVQTMSLLVNELAPGGATPRHRHLNESIVYVLSGRGHTEVEGTIHPWGEGDVITTPLHAWHQHFNDDPDRPVRYLGVTNVPLLRGMGLNQRDEE